MVAKHEPEEGEGIDRSGGPVVDPTKNVSGVYRILCLVTGKVYIGSSLDTRRRIYGHRRKLIRGKHANAHLQAAWDKHGADAFVFEVVEAIYRPEFMLDAEQRHMDLHDATNRERGFNIRLRAESNFGLPVSEQTRARISAAHLGHDTSAETRAKIGAKHRGKTISVEARAKMSAAKLGKTLSAETRTRMSVSTLARGPEWRARLSASRMGNTNSLGRKHPPEVREKISAASKAMWAARRDAGEAK